MEIVGVYILCVGYWVVEWELGKCLLFFFNGIGVNMEFVFGFGEWICDCEIIIFDMLGVG